MTQPTDGGALRDLFAEEQFVRRLARSLVVDASSVDDLVQQAYLRALESAPPSLRRPRAWFAQVVRRLAVERHRTDTRRTQREQAVARAEAGPPTVDLVSLEEQRHRLSLAVAALPEPYRDTLLRHYRSGWSYSRIARHDGVDRAAIESRIRRAKAKLRAQLGATSETGAQPWALTFIPMASGFGTLEQATATGSVAGHSMLKVGILSAAVLLSLLALSQVLPTGEAGGQTRLPVEKIAAVPSATPERGDAQAIKRAEVRTNTPDSVRSPPPMPGLAQMRGRLVHTDGTPVSGIQIGLLSTDNENGFVMDAPRGAWSNLSLTKTVTKIDDRGHFTFEDVKPGVRYALDLNEAGGIDTLHILERSAAPDDQIDLGTIVVARGQEWTGRVLDHEGNAVSGATVRLGRDLDGALLTRLPIHHFDPEGGMLNGFAQPTEGLVQGADWEHWSEHFRVKFSSTFRSSIKGPLARIVLETPDRLDALVANLPLPTSVTDELGHFRFSGERKGSQLVMVRAPNGVKKLFRIKMDPQASHPYDVHLPNPQPFETRLLDSSGQPIVGATVCVALAFRRVLCATRFTARWVKTDGQGRALVTGIPYRASSPEFPLTIAARRGAGLPWHFWKDGSGDQLAELTWPQSLSMEFRVEAGPGVVFDRRHLSLVQGPPLGDAIEFGLQPKLDLEKLMRREKDGRAVIQGLVPGFYTLVYRAPDAVPIALGVPVGTKPLGTEIVLSIQPVHRHIVRVSDHAGQPVMGALVRTRETRPPAWDRTCVRRLFTGAPPKSESPRWLDNGRTDESGSLEIGLASRESWVVATHPHSGAGSVRVAADQAAGSTVDIVLAAPSHVSGIVRNNGQPLSRTYTLRLQPSGTPLPGTDARQETVARTRADGSFEFPPAQPGAYRLVARPATRPSFAAVLADRFPSYDNRFKERNPRPKPHVESIQLESGSRRWLQLDIAPDRPTEGLGYADLTGAVSVDGNPAKMCQVVAEEHSDYNSNDPRLTTRRSGTTDASGNFRLPQLRPGKWQVTVRRGKAELARVEELTIPHSRFAVVQDFDIRTGTLIATVLDPEGQPAVGAKIRCAGPGYIMVTAETDARGIANVCVAQGTYSIHIDGRIGRTSGIQVRAGKQTAAKVQILRSTNLTITFSAKKLPSHYLLRRENKGSRIIKSLDKNPAKIKNIQSGWYRVEFRRDDWRVEPERFEVRSDRPDNPVSIKLTPR